MGREGSSVLLKGTLNQGGVFANKNLLTEKDQTFKERKSLKADCSAQCPALSKDVALINIGASLERKPTGE